VEFLPVPTDKPKLAKADSYADFIRSLELFAIALTTSSSRLDRDEYYKAKEPDLTVAVAVKPKRLSREHFDLQAEARVKLTGKGSGCVFDLSVTYDLHFHGKPPIDAKLVRRFAESDAHLVSWPYLRECVSDVSARMYIRPILLPVSM
jgi:preprotein translocase subunit SecB